MNRTVVAAAVAVAVLAPAGGCAKTATPGGTTTTTPATLGVTNPTRAELEEVTGVRFPASVDAYRSVQVSPGGVDVAATVAVDEVDDLVTDSGFGPLRDERVIAHSSPVWALNPGTTIRGTTTRRDGLVLALEVVGDDEPRGIRLSVRAGG